MHLLKHEILSNLIFKTKSNGIKLDRDLILKKMPKKKVNISGENLSLNCSLIFKVEVEGFFWCKKKGERFMGI